MSAAKHTPGPWEVLDGRRVSVVLPSLMEDCGYDSHCIALTHDSNGRLNAEANARLIAAAPDMLIALKLMTMWDKPMGPETPEWECAIRAIAKATKDQP